MALLGGYRFAVPMEDAFPFGVYALGVEQAEDYDEASKRRSPAHDKHTGQLVWTVTCIDRDPEARKKEVKVKVTGAVMPTLPREIAPGSGLAAVEFEGLVVTPYIEDTGRRPRIVHSFRATEVREARGVSAPRPISGEATSA